MTRAISAILLILILVGAVALVFVFFRTSPKVQILTITKEGKFDPTELKVANTEVLKIENKDDRKHTVRNTASNTNVVTDLEEGKTSGEIVFDDNSRNALALADDKNIVAAILVGAAPAAPEVKQTPTTVVPPATNTAPAQTTPATNQSSQPLPTTGAADNLIYLVILFVGVLFFLTTQRILPFNLSKLLVKVNGHSLIVHQGETTLVEFQKSPSKN